MAEQPGMWDFVLERIKTKTDGMDDREKYNALNELLSEIHSAASVLHDKLANEDAETEGATTVPEDIEEGEPVDDREGD